MEDTSIEQIICELYDKIYDLNNRLIMMEYDRCCQDDLTQIKQIIDDNHYQFIDYIESQKECLMRIDSTDDFINTMTETMNKQIYEKVYEKADKLQWNIKDMYWSANLIVNNTIIEIRVYSDKLQIIQNNYIISEYMIDENLLNKIKNTCKELDQKDVLNALNKL